MENMVDPSDLGREAIRPITRHEFERMVEAGIFEEDEHIELLYGWLVRMSPAHPPHAFAIQKLNAILAPALAGRAEVRIQSSFAVGDYSLPEPDIAVVDVDAGMREHPYRAYLVVEASDSSLAKDRRVKGPLYAAAGIPEYWIVNVNDRCIEVRRDPGPNGYSRTERVPESGSVSLAAFPDVSVPVAKILPPPLE